MTQRVVRIEEDSTGLLQRLIDHLMGIHRAAQMSAAREDHDFRTSVSIHLQQWRGAGKLVDASIIVVDISIWQLLIRTDSERSGRIPRLHHGSTWQALHGRHWHKPKQGPRSIQNSVWYTSSRDSYDAVFQRRI